jgi:hypothetical protein
MHYLVIGEKYGKESNKQASSKMEERQGICGHSVRGQH